MQASIVAGPEAILVWFKRCCALAVDHGLNRYQLDRCPGPGRKQVHALVRADGRPALIGRDSDTPAAKRLAQGESALVGSGPGATPEAEEHGDCLVNRQRCHPVIVTGIGSTPAEQSGDRQRHAGWHLRPQLAKHSHIEQPLGTRCIEVDLQSAKAWPTCYLCEGARSVSEYSTVDP